MTPTTGSDPRGLWVTIDGPAGTGKTTTVALVAKLLTATGHRVHRTQQPSRSTFGQYVRHALTALDGYPLACVLAADRYAQLHDEIAPALAGGTTVVSDRYVASIALDLLRGVPADVLWQLHAALPRPDLAVILSASNLASAGRVRQRGPHSRWQTEPGNADRESVAYTTITEVMTQMGWPMLILDTTAVSPRRIAEQITAGALHDIHTGSAATGTPRPTPRLPRETPDSAQSKPG